MLARAVRNIYFDTPHCLELMDELQLIKQARAHGNAVAISSDFGELNYPQLLEQSAALATTLLNETDDLNEACIAFLAPAGAEYTIIQWASGRSGCPLMFIRNRTGTALHTEQLRIDLCNNHT